MRPFNGITIVCLSILLTLPAHSQESEERPSGGQDPVALHGMEFFSLLEEIYDQGQFAIDAEETSRLETNRVGRGWFSESHGRFSGYKKRLPIYQRRYNEKTDSDVLTIYPLLTRIGKDHGHESTFYLPLFMAHGKDPEDLERADPHNPITHINSWFTFLPLLGGWASFDVDLRRLNEKMTNNAPEDADLSKWRNMMSKTRTAKMAGLLIPFGYLDLKLELQDAESLRHIGILNFPKFNLVQYSKNLTPFVQTGPNFITVGLSTDQQKVKVLNPLFSYKKFDDERFELEILPLLARNVTETNTQWVIAPLMLRSIRNKEDGSKTYQFDPGKLWPVYYRDEARQRTEILWPLFSKLDTPHMKKTKLLSGHLVSKITANQNASSLSILRGLIWRQVKTSDYTESNVGFGWLWKHRIGTEGDERFLRMTPFFSYRQKKDSKTWKLFGIPIRKESREASNP